MKFKLFELEKKDIKDGMKVNVDIKNTYPIHTSPIETCAACHDPFYGVSEISAAEHIISSIKLVKTIQREVNGKIQIYNGKRWVNSYL